MTVWLAAAALVAAAGAVAALAAADARLGLVGLAAGLIGAALLADPLPSPAVVGVRLTAALLALAMLRAAAPPAARRAIDDPEHDGRSRLGWPAEALLGAAGAGAGLAIAAGVPVFVAATGGDTVVSGLGPGGPFTAAGLAFALACGLAALALPALVAEPLGPRRATAAVLLTAGVLQLRAGLGGPPGVLEEVVLDTLLVAVAAGAALLAGAGGTAIAGGAHHP